MAAFSIIGREGSVPVHVWAKTLDDKSREQLLNTASLPFVFITSRRCPTFMQVWASP